MSDTAPDTTTGATATAEPAKPEPSLEDRIADRVLSRLEALLPKPKPELAPDDEVARVRAEASAAVERVRREATVERELTRAGCADADLLLAKYGDDLIKAADLSAAIAKLKGERPALFAVPAQPRTAPPTPADSAANQIPESLRAHAATRGITPDTLQRWATGRGARP